MVYIINNLIADLLLHIDQFPVQARDLQAVSQMEVGPGGACNVAIAAARLGLDVACLGEVGDDQFGRVVLNGLRREGVDTGLVEVDASSQTPVAAVLVDAAGEPGYLGYAGKLRLTSLPEAWITALAGSDGLFVDGWAEYTAVPDLVLSALTLARNNGGVTFFDPGPGNPRIDNEWHQDGIKLSDVLLVNAVEAARLSGEPDPRTAARVFQEMGVDLIVMKRGANGCLLVRDTQVVEVAGLPVTAVDTTGAGDSLAGALMAGYFKGLDLSALGQLANAAGAAKVQKVGTGFNVPTRDEITAVYRAFGLSAPLFLA